MNNKPNPISKYYIAYFDILGYREYFNENPDRIENFLNIINEVINRTKFGLSTVNNSFLAQQVGNLKIESKIFSDNILLVSEFETDISKGKTKLVTFMEIIIEIQRMFVLEYGLFVRGGITYGNLSINDDYIFGQGLIEAVEIEERTTYPRIAISDLVLNYLQNEIPYTQDDIDKTNSIIEQSNKGEAVSEEQKSFADGIYRLYNQETLLRCLYIPMLYQYDDSIWSLSYLNAFDISKFFPQETLPQVIEIMKQISPEEASQMPLTSPDINKMLERHKQIVEEKLIKYSDYSRFNTNDIKAFEINEKVLKKYVWAMVYHNYICALNHNTEQFINTNGNCERRHMKLVIHVVRNQNHQE